MSCLVTAVFPLLLVDKKESLLTMYVLSLLCNPVDDFYFIPLLKRGWRGYNFVYRFTWGLSCCRRDDWKAPSSSFFPDFDDDPGKL